MHDSTQAAQVADSPDRQRARALVGRVISGRYRLAEILATGGMATVYLAKHVHMHKRVAIKILHSSVEQLPELVRRFEREAVAGAHIQHPNVAAATDFGELEKGSFFLVMEYVQGSTLSEINRRGPIPVPRAVHIARQLAAALDAAHAKGIVHRDVKPLNVMVAEGENDLVKLLDFGFARVPVQELTEDTDAGQSLVRTQTGVVFGTLAYISPEAALGMDAVDARSDIYALGHILYEMLAGKHAFLTKDPVELFNQQVRTRPPPFAEHAPNVKVPPAIERVVMKLLEKDPAARYPTGAAVIAALDEACAASGIAVPSAAVVHAGPSPAAWTPPLSSRPRAALQTLINARPRFRMDRIATYFVFAVLALGVAIVALNMKRVRLSRAQAPSLITARVPEPPLLALPEAKAGSETATVPATEPAAEPVTTSADREALVEAVKAKEWDIAADVLLSILARDQAAIGERPVAAAARDTASTMVRDKDDRADRILRALANDTGTAGLDVLYDIVATQGRSVPATRAAALLRKPAVAARMTPELSIAFALRDTSCKKKKPLLERAVAEGDDRALIALESVVKYCFRPPTPALEAAERLRKRLKGLEER